MHLDELTVEGVQTNLQEFDLLFSQDEFLKKPPQRSNQELDEDSERTSEEGVSIQKNLKTSKSSYKKMGHIRIDIQKESTNTQCLCFNKTVLVMMYRLSTERV